MAPILSSLSGLYKSFLTSGGGAGGLGVEATGGAITEYQDGSTIYRLHTFAYNQNFTYTSGPGTVDVLVLAGGGAGGRCAGDQDTGKGGGGCGGMAYATNIPIAEGTTCAVVVGAGGAGNYAGSGYNGRTAAAVSIPGNDSTFTIPSGPYTITALGGGAGGVSDNFPSYPVTGLPNSNAGRPGGSGGGGGTRTPSESSYPNAAGPGQQPAQNSSLPWVVNYGTPGGSGTTSNNAGGGGGGGLGGGGNNTNGGTGGQGGPGRNVFGSHPAASTTLFMSNAYIGTKGEISGGENWNTSPNGRAIAGNTTTMYIGGGGSGGSAPGSPVAGGRGGGGRGTSGLNYAQSASGTLAPLADVPQFHGLDFSGGGGGGSADDPLGDPGSGGSTIGMPSGVNGGGGKGVVVVRYALSTESLTTEADEYITASGGTVTTDGDYKIHTFTHPNPTNYGTNYTDTFTVTQLSSDPLLNTIRVLVVGGGGGGGVWYGAGGGGGGVAETFQYPLPGAGSVPISIPVQVGIGGGPRPKNSPGQGNSGGDSHFGPASVRVLGIGGGAGGNGGGNGNSGADGGSGGGGGQSQAQPVSRPGRAHQLRADTTVNATVNCFNYGYPGAYAASSQDSDAGGGGGAGGLGGPGGGPGGTGMSSSITGSSVAYAGGGGAANPQNNASGGSGGGGAGGGPNDGGDGTPGLGGGGGGKYSGGNGSGSGAGGSGVVIVRYKYQ
tara:strand:+ start:4283 stop:6433 length:2151 start_codon:yes stop_codon:yes gene_type:complete